ncbi:2-succinyl-6-hydroxy-2,4-cyclohexadiene-1-carboxylate synthase [Liquorilactobacillus satsumensis]|uniref:2-succinyl-6-hydroxy-2, 4-cyclohexadiene-1-carboxylate synthase n=1 Tax=Liquorilactobacillus satsumensis TaxID=259059 RepID=UPI0039E7A96B
MKIKLNDEEYYFQTMEQKRQGAEQWILLHGFMGSAADFQQITPALAGSCIIPDLLGHGHSLTAAPASRFSIERQVADMAALITRKLVPPVNVWGYSMGGRLALQLTLTYPHLVKFLVLESATAGITAPAARRLRQQHDAQLALKLQREPLANFVAAWEKLPLFASQQKLPFAKQAFVHKQRMGQHANCLAASLRGMGTGQMPDLWPELSKIKVPVLLLCGEYDSKYQYLTAKLQHEIPNAFREVIPKAGHNVHLEQPQAVLQALGRIEAHENN